jgi:6-phosphogluconate dehydrogenase (decarboxylating)
MSELKIGFVGIGDQGAPMAEAISEAGFELHVWARRAHSFDAISKVKYLRHDSLKSLAAKVDVLRVLAPLSGSSLSPTKLIRGSTEATSHSDMVATPLELGLRAGGNWFHDANGRQALTTSRQGLSMTSAIAKEFPPSRLDTVNSRHAGGSRCNRAGYDARGLL